MRIWGSTEFDDWGRDRGEQCGLIQIVLIEGMPVDGYD
jgi:hypothetical protein